MNAVVNKAAGETIKKVAKQIWALFGPAIMYAIGEVAIKIIDEKIINKYDDEEEEEKDKGKSKEEREKNV
jgi:hypothetical protein